VVGEPPFDAQVVQVLVDHANGDGCPYGGRVPVQY